jgi:dissimilatory sulfite reductase (desulfoviridin) alpha/beta subunit
MVESDSCEPLPGGSRTDRNHCFAPKDNEVRGYQVETCAGPRGCPNRAIVCEGLAEEIGERLAKQDLKSFLKGIIQGPLKVHHELRVSVSDCPNACSRPQIADIGLIGARHPIVTGEICNGCGACVETCREAAIALTGDSPTVDPDRCLACGKCITVCPTGTLRAGRNGYRILLGGKLGRHPRLGTELPGIFNKADLLKIIDLCVDYYKTHCVEGERLGEIMSRNGEEDLVKKIIPVTP